MRHMLRSKGSSVNPNWRGMFKARIQWVMINIYVVITTLVQIWTQQRL